MSYQADLDRAVVYWTAKLLRRGYCVIPNLLPADELAALDGDLAFDFEHTPFCQGRFYGEQTKRFGRILARSRRAALLVEHDLVLRIVQEILSPYCDMIQLNLTQATAVHPGALGQMPHRDQDMWRGPTGEIEYLVNVMWPLTPFTRENGATRVWPESHGQRIHQTNSEVWEQPEIKPGSALLFLGSTLHAAGANRSSEVRRGLIAGYSLGWLRTYENQFLAYPPAIARSFSPELAALVGYRQHRPNLGNFEGQCPSVLLGDCPGARLAAIDALLPDQAEAVDEHAALERRSAAA